MAGVKITQLGNGGALQPTDAFPVARGNLTRFILGNQLLDPLNNLSTRVTTLENSSNTLQTSITTLSSTLPPIGSVIQQGYAEIVDKQVYTGNLIPKSKSNLVITDGHQILSTSFALKNSSNYLIISGSFQIDSDSVSSQGPGGVLMLFANNDLIAQRQAYYTPYRGDYTFILRYYPNRLNSVTYSVRAGVEFGKLLVNHDYGQGTGIPTYDSGKQISSISIQEIRAV